MSSRKPVPLSAQCVEGVTAGFRRVMVSFIRLLRFVSVVSGRGGAPAGWSDGIALHAAVCS